MPVSQPQENPYVFDVETVKVPIPEGDSTRHLYEAKITFTAPAGFSVNEVFSAVCAWILHGSRGRVEVLAEYGGGIKNKTLISPRGRSAMLNGLPRARVVCTAFEGAPIPRKDTEVLVVRKKQETQKNEPKKKVKRGTRG